MAGDSVTLRSKEVEFDSRFDLQGGPTLPICPLKNGRFSANASRAMNTRCKPAVFSMEAGKSFPILNSIQSRRLRRGLAQWHSGTSFFIPPSFHFQDSSSAAAAAVVLTRRLFAEGGGGRSLITSHHLEVSSDYDAFGIRESGVLFHVAEFPKHGKLDVTVWERDSDNIFTLLDLNTDKGCHSLDA